MSGDIQATLNYFDPALERGRFDLVAPDGNRMSFEAHTVTVREHLGTKVREHDLLRFEFVATLTNGRIVEVKADRLLVEIGLRVVGGVLSLVARRSGYLVRAWIGDSA